MTDGTPRVVPDPRSSPPDRVRRSGSKRALGIAVSVAALILLLGIATLLSRPGIVGDGASATPSVPVETATPASATPASSDPSSKPTASASSATASAAPVAVLAGAGDIGDCSTEADSRTADLLDSIDGTVFTVGDNAYDSGTAEEFAACYDSAWGRHKDRTRPATGNHDWRTGTLDGYFGYFGDAARGPTGDSWYSYDIGAWHVIVLDSECDDAGGCGPDSAQGRWLAADLEASTASCTVAMWHRPRFSSGFHGNDRSVGPFWTALYEADADVVINGHDHDYERFAPQDPDGTEDRARGIRQFVAGTGGTDLRPFEVPVANSELRSSLTQGILKLTLRDGSYDWEFLSASGDFSDSGTAFCH